MLLLRSEPLLFTLETVVLIFAIYSLPFYILDYVTSISNNNTINTISYYTKNIFFTIPIINQRS